MAVEGPGTSAGPADVGIKPAGSAADAEARAKLSPAPSEVARGTTAVGQGEA